MFRTVSLWMIIKRVWKEVFCWTVFFSYLWLLQEVISKDLKWVRILSSCTVLVPFSSPLQQRQKKEAAYFYMDNSFHIQHSQLNSLIQHHQPVTVIWLIPKALRTAPLKEQTTEIYWLLSSPACSTVVTKGAVQVIKKINLLYFTRSLQVSFGTMKFS